MAEWTLAQHIVFWAFIALIPIGMYWESAWDWVEERRRRAARQRRSIEARGEER